MYWRREYFNRKKEENLTDNIERYFYEYLEDDIEVKEAERLKDLVLMTTRNAISTLSEKCQKLIKLFYYDEKSMTEISQIMGFNNAVVATSTKYRCFNIAYHEMVFYDY